jgi:hypothetical protein
VLLSLRGGGPRTTDSLTADWPVGFDLGRWEAMQGVASQSIGVWF